MFNGWYVCLFINELFEICFRFKCFFLDNVILVFVFLKLKNYFLKYYYEYIIICILVFLFLFLSIIYNILYIIGIFCG